MSEIDDPIRTQIRMARVAYGEVQTLMYYLADSRLLALAHDAENALDGIITRLEAQLRAADPSLRQMR